MKRFPLLLLVLLPCALAATAQDTPRAPAQASSHAMVHAASIQWGDAPPVFEPGARFAVMSGDPSKDGLFVVRLKMPAGYRIARHWHPADEHVTVLQGALSAEMGTAGDARPVRLAAGDYALMPARMPHQVTAESETIVQVHGRGPFELHYVDPKDDPGTRGGK